MGEKLVKYKKGFLSFIMVHYTAKEDYADGRKDHNINN